MFYTKRLNSSILGIAMLVLTRKENESLIIGDNIKLTILSVKGGQVRVGIEAPLDVSVQRGELILKANDSKTIVQDQDESYG